MTANQPVIKLDAANLHPSTESCLEALQWLQSRDNISDILEIGCGNGILSAVAAGIWDTPVLAADISPKAISDAAANIKAHGLSERITIVRSDGFSHAAIAQNGPYGLIICNLLAELQARIARDIKKHLKSDGYLLLSGILAWKAPEIEQAYTGLGFEITHKIEKTPWVTLIFRHTTDTN